jgi:hypothetical protein
MGYDMSIVDPDAETIAAKEANEQANREAVTARDDYDNQTLAAHFPDLKAPVRRPENSGHYNKWDWSSLSEQEHQAFRQAHDLLMSQDAEFASHFTELQTAVERTFDEGDDPTYFRLNIHGMGKYRALMDGLGMLNYTDPPEDWPDRETFKIPQITVHPDYTGGQDYLDDDESSPQYAAYEAAYDEWRGFMPEGTGITLAKLCSNDGWIVTPEECESALAIWDVLDTDTKMGVRQAAVAKSDDEINLFIQRLEQGEAVQAHRADGSRIVAALIDPYVPDPANYWDSWIAFLRRAEASGGFQVW